MIARHLKALALCTALAGCATNNTQSYEPSVFEATVMITGLALLFALASIDDSCDKAVC